MAQAQIFSLLEAAASQDPAVMTPATEQLVAWETQAGFYPILYDIVSNRKLRADARLIGVLFFKNRVDRYWRKNVTGSIAIEDKAAIRQKLLSALDEPVNHLAMQEAVLIGKIARFDVPVEWPDLIPYLQTAIRDGQPLQQSRALLILYRVAKALVSKRLVGGRRLFKQMATEVFEFIYATWQAVLDPTLQGYSHEIDQEQFLQQFEHARLLLKVLRIMVVQGVSDHDQLPHVVEFFGKLVERHQMLLQLRENMADAHAGRLSESVDKSITLAHKVYVDVQEKHPTPFASLIGIVFPFIHGVILTGREASRRPKLERSVILAMRLVIQILGCTHYVPSRAQRLQTAPLALVEPNAPLSEAKKRAITAVVGAFSHEVLMSLCQVLMTQYFVLTNEDNEQWAETPEEYAFEEVGDAWKFSMRPCAEHLYVKLLTQYRGVLSGPIMETVQAVLAQAPTDTHSLLQREAAYTALCAGGGLSSFSPIPTELHDVVDFDALFTSTLVAELTNTHEAYKIVRRRICEVIGQWASVRFDKTGKLGLRTGLYQLMINLLGPSEDLVVRITAMGTLKSVVNDFGFHAEEFLPHLNGVMGALFQLLVDVEQCESKMKVLDMINELVDRMGSSIQEFSATLAGYLPGLWATAGASPEYGMLRTSIVRSYVKLVEALGSKNEEFYEFLCTVILHSIDTSQPQHEYLLEDGMELWHRTVQFAPVPTASLFELFGYVTHLMDREDGNGESTKTCLLIVESYIILGGAFVLENYGPLLVAALTTLIRDDTKALTAGSAKILCRSFDLMLYAFPEHGCALLADGITALLVDLLEGGDAVGSGHAGLYPPYMAVINRLALIHPQHFGAMVTSVSTARGADVMPPLLDLWIDKFDVVSEPGWRKLSVLAMVQCIGTEAFDAYVHPRLGLVLNMIINALHQFHMYGDEPLKVDYLVQFGPEELSEPAGDEPTAEPGRKRRLSRGDAVCTHNLAEFVNHHIMGLQARLGPAGYEALIATVDPSIMQQLTTFMTGLAAVEAQ